MAAVDRISELPESILHHILFFLSQKEAIQTSALSKTWRHVVLTGPKIELRDRWFQKSGKASFLSVLSNTLQRYDHPNLSKHEFILQMSSDPESISILDKGIPTLLTNTAVKKFDFNVPGYALDSSLVFRAEFLTDLYLSHCKFKTSTTTNNNNNNNRKPLFKGLKRLSLYKVCIAPEMFVQIMLSCPLIEYLCLYDCPGLKTIPETIFQAESLTELDLSECNLTSITQPLLIKRLKKLSLDHVYISEDTVEEIMCSCPLIECVVLSECDNMNWSHNNINNNPLRSEYAICLDWYGHDKYFFPRLKTLYLERVNLSAELFESFSSNFPSLEDLELDNCYGFSEIQLTVSSIKRLAINMDSTERMVININAPNIHCFELSIRALPELIFHTETAKEWESHVHVLFNNDKVLHLPWLLQLSELLNSLSESQIYLDLYSNLFKDLKVENTNDVVFCKPVPVQRVYVDGDIHRSCSFLDLLDCLLLICRPRYIGDMNWYTTKFNSGTGRKKGKNKLVEYIISEIIRNQGKMSQGYLWERDLEEISMQVWDEKSKGWRNVRVEGTCFPEFTSSYTKIRFPLKWKSGD